ncbi:LLM class flavin-dependent oxidoreductase [Rhizobium sp. 2TAF27]|uniref:LLM class flavin-dependent oxidoreductase n=1 Tax=Rhizobium sp. 2TAF27 TaxID=3233013 RepID=UPI003F9E7AA6
MTQRLMKLGAFIPAPGHHVAAWRHPDAVPHGSLDFNYYLDIVKIAENALFDMIFLSDGVGIRTNYRDEDELSRWGRVVQFEPLTLLSALAVHTNHIGLTATASTTYNEPFHIARKFASLDFLSNGRAGWNVVTSVTDLEAWNFNLDHQPDHPTRYRRAHEFMEVARQLWDSFDDGAFIADKVAGRMFDPEKLRIPKFRGEFFKIRGPLNVARPPQGYPVIVQAGSSDDGQSFAARWAEVIFTAQQRLDQAKAFRDGIRHRLTDAGRDPDGAVVMPGVFVVVGQNQSEADDRYGALQDLIDPAVGLGLLSGLLGDVDAADFPLDEPLPPLPETQGSKSRQALMYEEARRGNLTVRQLYMSVAGGRGHWSLIGSASMIADQLQEWFESGGADGFNIMPAVLPNSLCDFAKLVVPELQKRGLFRLAYSGPTLRDHLGLTRPARH